MSLGTHQREGAPNNILLRHYRRHLNLLSLFNLQVLLLKVKCKASSRSEHTLSLTAYMIDYDNTNKTELDFGHSVE